MKRIYIYGILDDDDNIIYVGESACPQRRLSAHHSQSGYKRCKILEIYENREHYWINKLLSEGNNLKNKEKLSEGETWCVGDIIVLKISSTPVLKLRNKLTGEIYRSGYHACQQLKGVGYSVTNDMRRYPTSKYHDILEFVD